MRASVLARITAAPPSRWFWRYVFAGTAAATIALAGVVQMNRANEGGRILPKPADRTAPVQLAKSEPTVSGKRSSPLTPVVNTARVERVSARTATQEVTANAEDAALAAWRARSTPALAHPNSLAVRPLELKTIDITPLDVAPLLVPALADGSNR
jgi:hypothetical protein